MEATYATHGNVHDFYNHKRYKLCFSSSYSSYILNQHFRFNRNQKMIYEFRFSLRVLHLLRTQPMLPTIPKCQLRVSDHNKNQTLQVEPISVLARFKLPEEWRTLCSRPTSEPVKFLLSVEVYLDVNKAELFGKLS